MNLCQHTKEQVISTISSKDGVDLKILQSDWSRVFWLISQEPDFSQYKILSKQGTMYYWTDGKDCCKTSCEKSKNSGTGFRI